MVAVDSTTYEVSTVASSGASPAQFAYATIAEPASVVKIDL